MKGYFSTAEDGTELVHVEIDHTSIVVSPATDFDRHRWKHAYKTFKAADTAPDSPAVAAPLPASEEPPPEEPPDGGDSSDELVGINAEDVIAIVSSEFDVERLKAWKRAERKSGHRRSVLEALELQIKAAKHQ